MERAVVARHGRLSPHERDGVALRPAEASLGLLSGVQRKQQIGKGQFGIVYMGSWKQRPVALKSLISEEHMEAAQARVL